MKLTHQELKGLQQMIEKTSSKVLNTYSKDNVVNLFNQDVIFIGDSMIEFFNLKRYLPTLNALNRGVAGATTKLILDNLDVILGKINPKSIFISIGSNDLVLLEASVAEAYENIIKVLDVLKSKFPSAKLYYLSTTPVVSTQHPLYKKIYIGGRTNGELKSINFKVMNYAKSNDMTYLHQFDDLLDSEGYLNTNYTYDGIHLNPKGYEVYARNILSNL
ncbi:GDSL-type esterase/lipase family protein [Acholeplasma laidlawii]|uniref:Esterase, SGNH hydrolase-type n=2 Tax=Acholeplasma laidlawii TaxID=2148 RepID=A9NH13_ACHLI|nr:GDSL-type esterase/lipase family protein [Acholeplasma laidlawii]ABX81643.1 esterase, SGNH hydrolase-type [Acholeplasma laidlawii PG-8A]NWH09781.1 hypothetical protein [Acholeplasma laidlawii]NWH11171.1 hypothetical protein [Acholeplasma laidlawii]NWH13418.1 hypothetical protein [Acholeplasma laidlawii]NWH14033.1 hypothetical protein [Acholeplasma laidlawii]